MPITPTAQTVDLVALLSTATPKTEATTGAAGSGSKAAREDHTHQRLTSVGPYQLSNSATNAVATVTFTRTFDKQPGVVCTLIESGTQQPVTFVVDSWMDADGADPQVTGKPYVGCVIKGLRSQMIPTLSAVSTGITLLSGLITGVNSLISALNQYNPFGGTAASAKFSCVVVASSQP